MAVTACEPCTAYRRGERENVLAYGFTIHACERKRDGFWGFAECPCGCVNREPGAIDRDRAIHGNAFIGPLGERIDPTTVAPLGETRNTTDDPR